MDYLCSILELLLNAQCQKQNLKKIFFQIASTYNRYIIYLINHIRYIMSISTAFHSIFILTNGRNKMIVILCAAMHSPCVALIRKRQSHCCYLARLARQSVRGNDQLSTVSLCYLELCVSAVFLLITHISHLSRIFVTCISFVPPTILMLIAINLVIEIYREG